MEFKLPDIGEGVHEGEIVRWLVKPGDVVKEDQSLVEVMTDKATVEIPTSQGGTVEKLMAEEGAMVKVGQVIALLKEGAAKATSAAPAPKAATQSPTPAPVSSAPTLTAAAAPKASAPVSHAMAAPSREYIAEAGTVLATPATRRLAREMGVDVTQVSGSGPAGRVTKEDVHKYVGASAAGPQTYAPQVAKATGTPFVGKRPASPLADGPRETLVPFRGIRRKIAEGMRLSKDTAAHFTYVDECDVTELVKFRSDAKKMAEEKGVKLTYLPFLIKAAIQALKKFPQLNSTLDEQGGNIIQKNYFNIGIAMDTPDGLMVPVVKDCERKSILEIAYEIQTLAEKAQNKKLAIDDLKGGTFTITNAGTIGGLFATPIINYPEVAILGFNKIAKRPHIKGDQIVIADMTWFSISVDHRVVDGADAARFINEFMSFLSNPKRLMLEMI